jgi:hypothetical protein
MNNKNIYMAKMTKDIKDLVKRCVICAKRKEEGSRRAPLQPIPPPEHGWQTMNMDIVGPLPTSLKGKIYFLVKGDYMKKYIIAAPMPDQTAETVIQTFIDSIVVENGVPERVLTDQGSNFLSRTIDDLYRQFGIERLRTTTYIPCCD